MRQVCRIVVALSALLAGASSAQATDWFVDPAGNDSNSCLEPGPATACLTLQAAINKAAASDTIHVAAGIYKEQVIVGISLTVVGAGSGNTTIKAPDPLPALSDIVRIDGSGVIVEMSALTVAGPGPLNSQGSINAGIHVMNGAQGILHDLAVVDIRDDPLTGVQSGRAVRVGDGDPAPNHATAVIHDCMILNYQKNGIDVRDAASILDAHDNVVTGPGETAKIASNGVVAVGASASIVHNAISGNECDVPTCDHDPATGAFAAGILLLAAAGGTTVANNTVSANDIGIFNNAVGATTLTGNHVIGNRFDGIILDQGDAAVSLNVIDGGNHGVLAVALAGDTANSSGTLTCNQITFALQAGIGLLIQPGATSTVVLTATNNSITGNALGIDNTIATGPAVDARQNWWGCSAGPGNTGCDSVMGNVDASSPLPAPPICPPLPTTTTTTSTTTPTTMPSAPTSTTTTVPPAPQCLSDASCGDGNICNGVETCRARVCTAGTPLDCDDGDPCTMDSCAPASGCQHTMVADLGSCSTVIPGGKNKKSDCYVFADLEGMHPIEKRKTLVCSDGDPTCDMDGTCNNVCVLQVRLCINSATLPPCTPPSQLTTLKFKSHPASFALNTPAQLTGPQCSAFQGINLPVKVSKKGKKSSGVLKVTASAKAPKGTKPKSDSDTYIMKCVPGCAPS